MSNRKLVIGLILVVIGFALLSKTLGSGFFIFDLPGFLFPIGLISIGIWLLARRRGQVQADQAETTYYSSSDTPPPPPFGATADEAYQETVQPPPPPGGSGENTRASDSPNPSAPGKSRYSKFIGDMYIDCNDVSLQNVEIGNFLGDVEVKLHGGKLSPGLNRMIISGFIGDVRVLVPQGMAVFSQCSNFIGDIEMIGRKTSGFGNSLDAQTPDYDQAESKLYIASNHFIGDVRIYIV